MNCRTALMLVLDNVDYTAGNCRMNEMVGACLPKEVIALAREAIKSEEPVEQDNGEKCWLCERGVPHLIDYCKNPGAWK